MSKPRRRKADSCRMIRLWDYIGPYWHILTGVTMFAVVAIWWVGEVSSHEARISDLETQKATVQEIRINLKTLMNSMGVQYVDGR